MRERAGIGVWNVSSSCKWCFLDSLNDLFCHYSLFWCHVLPNSIALSVFFIFGTYPHLHIEPSTPLHYTHASHCSEWLICSLLDSSLDCQVSTSWPLPWSKSHPWLGYFLCFSNFLFYSVDLTVSFDLSMVSPPELNKSLHWHLVKSALPSHWPTKTPLFS